MPEGWGRAGVELGGTSGYRVGRGRCYRPWVVERPSVELAFSSRDPLHCTAFRCVHALGAFPPWPGSADLATSTGFLIMVRTGLGC